jgi:transposase-like protein
LPSLSARYFTSEDSARGYLEEKRWPNGPICPACGAADARKLTPAPGSKTHARKGLCQCNACRRQFSVTLGTLFEDSHIPLRKWLLAIYLICSNQKGMSAVQIQCDLDLGSYRTAWLMCHRIRWALQRTPMSGLMKSIGEAKPASAKKPLRIRLPWDDVVRGLLEVSLEPRDRPRGDRLIGAKLERRKTETQKIGRR